MLTRGFLDADKVIDGEVPHSIFYLLANTYNTEDVFLFGKPVEVYALKDKQWFQFNNANDVRGYCKMNDFDEPLLKSFELVVIDEDRTIHLVPIQLK